MSTKQIKLVDRHVPWTEEHEWFWPSADYKLLAVFDTVEDIDLVMQYVGDMRVCVQAGGACGIWPLRFSQLFHHVYTFEPHPTNFACLMRNTLMADNITAINAAVGSEHHMVKMISMPHEIDNYGAFQVSAQGEDDKLIPTFTIDDLKLPSCGLIYLDIEGFELFALRGARETISQYRPVIAVEDKGLSVHYGYKKGQIEFWLGTEFGYKVVARPHRDVILVPA